MGNVVVLSERKILENAKTGDSIYDDIPSVEQEMYKIYYFFKGNEQLFDNQELLLDYKGLYFVGIKEDDVFELYYEKKGIQEAIVHFRKNGETQYQIAYKKENEICRKVFKYFAENFFIAYFNKKQKTSV